jgi:hypothetical protein
LTPRSAQPRLIACPVEAIVMSSFALISSERPIYCPCSAFVILEFSAQVETELLYFALEASINPINDLPKNARSLDVFETAETSCRHKQALSFM